MKGQKIWKFLLGILWVLQAAAEIVTTCLIARFNVLPQKYLLLIVAVFVIFLLFTGVLMLTGCKKEKVCVRQIVALLVAFLFFEGNVYASHAVWKASNTMRAVTDGKSAEVTSMMGVYVLVDDAAESLADAADYSFVTAASSDDSELTQALSYIEEQTGKAVTPEEKDTLVDAAQALYDKKADALLINETYVNLLEDADDYADFSEKTKLLGEVSVTKGTSDASEEASTEEQAEKTSAAEPFLLYISGSDTRSKMLTTSRSDVNILAAVNPKTHQVLLINTPRDAYIPNPAGNGELDKLTHCGIYGIDCSIEALSDLYDEKIDNYVQINFTGFQKLIDAIDGVTVYSDNEFTTLHGNYKIVKGENHLNGDQALGFARERYSLPNGDHDRGEDQMKIITAVVEKLTSKDTFSKYLTNYSEIMDSLKGMFITDMTSDEITSLIKNELAEGAPWSVVSYAITGTGARRTTYSMPKSSLYVMYPDESTISQAKKLIDRVMDGETLTEEDVSAK